MKNQNFADENKLIVKKTHANTHFPLSLIFAITTVDSKIIRALEISRVKKLITNAIL